MHLCHVTSWQIDDFIWHAIAVESIVVATVNVLSIFYREIPEE